MIYDFRFLSVLCTAAAVVLVNVDHVVSGNVGGYGSAIIDSGAFVLRLTDHVSSQGRMARGNVLVIDNKSPHVLHTPTEWLQQGVVASVPPDEIPPSNRSMIKYTKKEYIWVWKGTVGVATYSIGNTGNQLVIYWHVPWNNLADKNKANVRIKRGVTANKELFRSMQDDESGIVEAVRTFGQTTRTERGHQLYLSMTNSGKAATFCEITGNGEV